MKQFFKRKDNQVIGLFIVKPTPPVFNVFLQGLLFAIVLFISQTVYAEQTAEQINVIEQCDQESEKEVLDIPLIKKVCLQAAKQKEANKQYESASWYYLLAGELDYLIKEMPQYIDPKTSTVIYANLGHAYVLKDQPNKAKEMYWKFLTLGGQNMLGQFSSDDYVKFQEQDDFKDMSIANIITNLQIMLTDNPMMDDYQLLKKRYPLNNEPLKKGLQYWEQNKTKFIKELQQADNFSSKGMDSYKTGKYSTALDWFQQALRIQERVLGINHPDTVTSFNNIGLIYANMGNYAKALDYELKALRIREKVLGKEHPDTAASYNNIGSTYGEMGNYAKALDYKLNALRINEKVLGKEHPDTAASYNNIGVTYGKMGNYAKALDYKLNALRIKEKALGKEHPNTAISYNNIGVTYGEMGNYAKALDYKLNALRIKEKALGKEHPDTAISYNNIGSTYYEMGNYAKALDYQLNALSILAKVLGKEHPDTATSYNNVGFVYGKMGNYAKALEYGLNALHIRKKVLGKEHPDTAASYNNIGSTYADMGNYSKTLEYQLNALRILEKVLGKEHPNTATSYNNVGLTYGKMGNHAKALDYQLKALHIQEKVLGKEHPDTAISYNNLGTSYVKMGNYAKALVYQFKSLRIWEKVLGKEHPDTAISYNNIGLTYEKMGNYTKALEYQLNALHIWEKVLGKEHPNTAVIYNNIGVTYEKMGNNAKALDYQLKGLRISEKVQGKKHPDTAISYNNIGTIYGKMGNYANAYRYTKKAYTIFLNQRENSFSALNSRQKKRFLKANERYIDFLLSNANFYEADLLSNKENQKVNNLQQSTTNDWLAYKGSILDAENRLMFFAKTAKSPELKKQYQAYIEAKQFFSKLNQNIPDTKEKISAWKKQLKTQEEKISTLEQAIKKADPRFKDEKNLQAIKTNDIAKALMQDSLYIDFAKTNAGYYLFTIDYQNNISFTAYSEEDSKAIDKKITAFKNKMQAIAENKKLIGQSDDKTKQTLGELYQLIFTKALLDKIADKKSLIISPDGALRLLPFEALLDAKTNEYFIEKEVNDKTRDIRYIASGKELVRLFRQNKDKTSSNNKTVLFANPDFKGKPSKAVGRGAPVVYTPNTSDSRTLSVLEPNFGQLAGTKKEADAISQIVGSSNLMPYYLQDANEANLISVKTPKVLHLATHGFFLDGIPNPMLKSGLILAGANRSIENHQGDGIVTALDLSGLNLKGTDLVVLSACETGKVDPNNTDGISGLTKAFIQAGAKDVVMSLWSVADNETASLMKSFYTESQKNKSQYATALKKSKLELLHGNASHPYYWAAFVLSGL